MRFPSFYSCGILANRWDILMSKLSERHKSCYPSVDNIILQYSAPYRKYHNINHLVDMFTIFDGVDHLMEDPNAVELAIFYHDYIYDPLANNNEDCSAGVMITDLRYELGFGITNHTRDLIMATTHKSTNKLVGDERWIVDLDLAILGFDSPLFDKWGKNIREEYIQIDDESYRNARKDFLLGMLNRDHIYNTQVMRQRYESIAVENISRAIKELKNEDKTRIC